MKEMSLGTRLICSDRISVSYPKSAATSELGVSSSGHISVPNRSSLVLRPLPK